MIIGIHDIARGHGVVLVEHIDLEQWIQNVTAPNYVNNKQAFGYSYFVFREGVTIPDMNNPFGPDLVAAKRLASNVGGCSAIFLDIDENAPSVAQMAQKLQALGHLAVLYTSWSHTTVAPRYRIVFPLAKPIPVEYMKPVTKWMAGQLGVTPDPVSYNRAQIMYLSHTIERPHESHLQRGPLLDPNLSEFEPFEYKGEASGVPENHPFKDTGKWPCSKSLEMIHDDLMEFRYMRAGQYRRAFTLARRFMELSYGDEERKREGFDPNLIIEWIVWANANPLNGYCGSLTKENIYKRIEEGFANANLNYVDNNRKRVHLSLIDGLQSNVDY
ncbi:hypothetical protein [Chromobacterium haemolyticum]|uniref:Primase C-terminal 1 domain-containing protein n=1 Tax=Chromobacterium haemolyticum TaxID=394935 RepID=A0A1W0D1W8_9NEIS|nr:hypothetical protein [Chromobacterium haemolyticum]OQS41006.1 hypothetical protein B0T45_09230 [Chromobacterium haemolyticum]